MPPSKHLNVDLTFVLCPQYQDLETDDTDPSDVLNALEELLVQIDQMSISIGDICHKPYSGKIYFSVEPLNQRDMQTMVGLSEWATMEGDSIALRVHAEFDNSEHITKQRCSNIAEMLVKKLFVLMTFYLPGSSDCKYVYPTYEESDFPNLVCRSSFQRTALALTNAKIRPTPAISFFDFFNWSTRLSGFWTGEAMQPVSRCLNFVSYVHHHTHQLNTLSDFSWIMAALEALLADNSSDVRSKMVRRTLLLAPEIESFLNQKQIGKIYDFRSRFIHGDLKIRNHFYDDFAFDWPGNEFAENFSDASAILFKCVHSLAEKGWTTVSFQDSVTGSP